MSGLVVPGPGGLAGDLAPISAADWSYDRAAHLLPRAGFGGTPEEIEALAGRRPRSGGRASGRTTRHPRIRRCAVRRVWTSTIRALNGSRRAGRRPPSSRDRRGARAQGQAGRQPSGPAGRRQVLLLAARDHARDPPPRVLVGGPHAADHAPVEEKMALFWHGHFATSENKVRDYRKMLQQNDLFERRATGDLRELMSRSRRTPRCSTSSTRGQRQGLAERELRPRDHGAVHHGRGPLLARTTSASARARSPAGTSTT